MQGHPQFPNEQTDTGEFKRQSDAFRDWVTDDGRSGYPAAAGRYHLYVSLACPWAHRTIIVRMLKRLGVGDRHDGGRPDPRRTRLGLS